MLIRLQCCGIVVKIINIRVLFLFFYNMHFSINEDTGEIKLAQSLKGHLIHRITVFVEVRDKHAVENIKDQIHRGKVTPFF